MLSLRYIFTFILIAFSAIAFFYSTRIFYGNNRKKTAYVGFSLMSLGSAFWSLGYGLMFFFDDEKAFMVSRGIGITGLIMFLLCGQFILMHIIGLKKAVNASILLSEVLVGMGVMFMILRPSSFTMEHTQSGIVTTFTSGGISIAYTLYTVVMAAIFIAISIYMVLPNRANNVKTFGRNFLIVEGLIIAGMVVDTIMPAIGINLNIPGSTLFQFVGLDIVYHAVHRRDRNTINLTNMAVYIYRSLRSPVLVFDENHKLSVANNQAVKMFGITEPYRNFDFWNDCFNMEPPKEILTSTETVSFTSIYEKSQIYCRLYMDPIYDEYHDFIGYIVIVSDMTEMVKKTKELEESRNEAQQANRTKSLFLANMSHEIRTPMNSILGFSDLAIKENVDEKSKEYFEYIHDSAEMLLGIINDILDFSKIESGKMELEEDDYDAFKLFEGTARLIDIQAKKKGLEFSTNISKDLPKNLHGDSPKIREVLINLLNNSVKYTREGSVALRVDFDKKNPNEGVMKIQVSDTGIGIKEEDIDALFDSFKRLDAKANSKTEGTGLGLAITKGLIEIMNGSIKVQSTYGTGSTFVVELSQKIVESPVVEAEETHVEADKNRKLMLKDINVLGVDDNGINLKVLRKILERYGLKIDVAPTGKDAIAKCMNKKYDLVLMDQMMPEMDGTEAMTKIRELGGGYEAGGNLKIVALTANAISGVREELMNLGFDEYLTKPIDVEELERLFINLLTEDQYYYE